ncbi:tRNA (adenosine(37)-N6)-threonylcarbamoyltransferase complex ATPase subunit type 1 TsaE [Oerskovia turbata]|uniref:tRNA threonylcarbamoyladenosine biosynthesis protein TsaE n=1 Tax=Oerskovia turbata TaxID=1713 RepID=A0A4Q1KRU7_9CELL|nr:tRNA (adenosine(37)-N6)-threonylcarbamoyltransferase complex ATPase subunit type 1 TsaE [Oerskovia turbata]RXR27407.1 tRNA (adenosine(37)-N6)-threonylcarbamoyltransferase complex ATPase subunit type 1 TsaE [Oerskovia turbata]RXR32365.1 tRNA (adenosine(37)-N6)-threonylcarbamoyltransferase complex ATPase subunit type 1 TsaE [Oerskovia turbata]
MTDLTFDLPDAEATRAFGLALARELRAGDLVMLTGDLGAGKTTLTQGIGTGLGVRGQVASPTFIIARVHPPLADGPYLVHVDAYRLGSLDEVEALDLDASLDESVTVVEWGQDLVESLAEDRLEITIERPRGGVDTSVTAGTSRPGETDEPVDQDDAPESPEAGVRHVSVRALGDRWADVARLADGLRAAVEAAAEHAATAPAAGGSAQDLAAQRPADQ